MSTKSTEFKVGWWNWVVAVPLAVFAVAYAVVFIAGFFVYCIAIRLAVWLWWCPRAKNILFVYSESPIWQEYIERNWLPVVEKRAIVLNWSQRKQWRPSLARAVFSHFGGHLNYNPMAVVFTPFGRTRIYRFFKPFHRFKNGDEAPLRELEQNFLAAVR